MPGLRYKSKGAKKTMVSLFIGSTHAYSGKNLTVMGIGQRFIKDGLRVGYFKPFGRLPIKVDNLLTDKDAWFIHRVLGLSDPLEALCPVVMTQDMTVETWRGEISGLMEKVREAFQAVSEGKDVVFIGGADTLESGKSVGVSGFDLSEEIDARVLLAHVLGVDAARLVAMADEAVGRGEEARYGELVARRLVGEPVARIVGVKEFWSRPFVLSPDVLVPRRPAPVRGSPRRRPRPGAG